MDGIGGSDLQLLVRLMSKAFSFDSLKTAVQAATGDPLQQYVGEGKSLPATISELLNALEEIGATPAFLGWTYANRPGKPELRALIASLCPPAAVDRLDPGPTLSLQRAGEALADQGSGLARAPGFQRTVRPRIPMLDVALYQAGLERARACVCRIAGDGAALGTGFLVGPGAVLTNWHVVERLAATGLSGVECQFDYLLRPDGSRSLHAAALAPDGLAAHAPYAPAEATEHPDTPPPAPFELDYALLRLAEPAGEARGWIALPDRDPAPQPDDPLLILQHPDGAPMKLAFDMQSVIGPSGGGLRLRYRTNTERGSSGSPCFDTDWRLLALHHFGDPNWMAPVFNQGIPAHLLRADIEAKGFGALLSAAPGAGAAAGGPA